MRLSSSCTRSLRLVLVGAVSALLVACGDAPSDPAVSFGHIDKGEGHGRVEGEPSITMVSQPEVTDITSAGRCLIEYSFQIDNAQGRVTVQRNHEHAPQGLLHLNAAQWNGREHESFLTHGNDDHTFTLILELLDSRGVLLDATVSDPVTSTCD